MLVKPFILDALTEYEKQQKIKRDHEHNGGQSETLDT